ncbi:phosphate ABC transporter substrate-binding protein [Phosphitispora sp. TUW77]|uniref:phosphate ABC transporter substrate-binding protein n=1 Tax=Phosphitispora sp. TUW77 TaxID=3152361 RepID=UPI003AB8A44B
MMVFNKWNIALLIVLPLLVMFAVAGCGGKQKQSNEDTNVKIAGSTSVQPLSEELAEVFMEKHPDVTVSVQGGGSTAGVEAANTGTANIGAASRELKDSEKGYGFTETLIAKDGIAVVVNPANKVDDLSMEQIKKIFSGEIKNWSQVGGKDQLITVVVREEGSGTRGAFEEIVLGKDGKFVVSAIIQNSSGAAKNTVINDPNGVAFISLGSVDSAVKALKVDGVEASSQKVLDGSYKISRPFLYLAKGEIDAVAKAYIEFVLSEEGQNIVAEEYVPIN